MGWLNILGQTVGLTSTEYGLANIILAAVSISTNGSISITPAKVVGMTIGLLFIHGTLNFLKTRHLAYLACSFVFINLGTTFLIIILLLAMTPRSEMHPASYIFVHRGLSMGPEAGTTVSVSFSVYYYKSVQ